MWSVNQNLQQGTKTPSLLISGEKCASWCIQWHIVYRSVSHSLVIFWQAGSANPGWKTESLNCIACCFGELRQKCQCSSGGAVWRASVCTSAAGVDDVCRCCQTHRLSPKQGHTYHWGGKQSRPTENQSLLFPSCKKKIKAWTPLSDFTDNAELSNYFFNSIFYWAYFFKPVNAVQ